MPSRKRRAAPVAPRPRRPRELSAAELRWRCDPALFRGRSAGGDRSVIGIIGQDRAIQALRLGIQLYAPGYNVFVCGLTGTGRATTVKEILNRIKGYCPLPPDRCYVHNFAKPDEPRLLSLPRGMGHLLQTDMGRFVRKLEPEVRRLLQSESHRKKRERVVSKYESEGDRIIERFERRAERKGFALKRVRDGNVSRPELFPILDGQTVPMGDLDRLVAEGHLPRRRAAAVVAQFEDLRQALEATARQSRELLSRMESDLADLEKKEVRGVLQDRADAIAARYPGDAGATVSGYLKEILDEVIANLDLFRRATLAPEKPAGPGSAEAAGDGDSAEGSGERSALHSLLNRFEVNVVFDSRRQGECPVVVETHPSYRRLFGYFEKTLDQSGHWTADFRHIRAGSLLAADGGYLVVTAEDLFAEQEVWMELKRTLTSRTLAIMEERSSGQVPTIAMKPQPIPLDVKVIMIGHRESYEALLSNEPDFRKIFKVLADFDQEMDLTPTSLRQYAAFVKKISSDEGLGEFEPAAIAAVAEYGARAAGRQRKLSTRFGDIADILREADYWRTHDGKGKRVLARHIRAAITESRLRRSLPEDKLREMVREGQIFIDATGSRVGQINGLVIEATGTHAFGLPARITATVSPGTAGIINIEREARMSGRAHTKGVLIIGGYLREMFGHDKPVTLTASIAFEQTYAEIDGDSASSTEIYALLSSLSGLPVRQGIAVTGSVDQMGDIQPVGGINEKIEGFFRVCQVKGLTGDQGVIVPEANLGDLMVDEEVVEAVRRRRFHIYPVRSVEEGIEILTGVAAGRRDASGRYPEGTVFGRADTRLVQLNDLVRRYPAIPSL